MKKIIMYHYVRSYSKEFPFFNFLHINNFISQIISFNEKKKILKLNDSIKGFFRSNDKILLSFDDGIKDHYHVFKKLLKMNLKAIFFIPSYPLVKNDFLSVHKIHLILGKYKSDDIVDALSHLNIKINFNKVKFREKNYQLKNVQNKEEKKKILIKIFLNFRLKKNNKKIIDKLFNYFYTKKYQRRIFKNFYLNKSQIKEINQSGMLIGGHSYSHKLLGLLNFKAQKYEIEKNIRNLNKIIGKKINFFAYPYGGTMSFNKKTIEILKKNKIEFSFNTGNKHLSNLKAFHNIQRINCNKFKFGKIYKY